MAENEDRPNASRAPLDAQDFLVLHLSLDMLSRHTDNELAEARRKGNSAKQMAMLTMRQRIANVRAKVQAMEPQS